MARCQVATEAWGYIVDHHGHPVEGALCSIDTTVYVAATGGSTIAPASWISNSEGYLSGFVDAGTYTFTDTDGDELQVEASRGDAVAGGADVPFILVAAPTGVSATDTAAIEAAIAAAVAAGGGTVLLAAGQYVTNPTTEWAQSNVTIQGQGREATEVYLANGANKDLIKSEDFDALTTTDVNTGIYAFALRHLSLNGNKANNTTSRGLSIYGYDWDVEDVAIHNFKGLGVWGEWGSTAAVSSDTLATGNMDCRFMDVHVHRNDGGGIYWNGPSDCTFSDVMIAKCGPASSTTTIGFEAGVNGYALVLKGVHVWGLLHKYSFKLLGASTQLIACQGEGASEAQVWILGVGIQIRGGWYFQSAAAGDPPGIKVGETAGENPGDLTIDTKLSNCGIYFERGGNGSSVKLDVYWADAAQSVVTGAPANITPINFDLNIRGGVKRGGLGTYGRHKPSRTSMRKGFPSGSWLPSGAICQSMQRQGAASNLPVLTSARLFLVGGLFIPEGETVTSITFVSGTQAAVTPTAQWFALYNAVDPANPAKLGVTSDDTTTAWGASTAKTLNLATPYVAIDEMQVYAGICVTAGTVPSLNGLFLATGMNMAPALGSHANAALTNPASAPATAGSLSASGNVPYVYLS